MFVGMPQGGGARQSCALWLGWSGADPRTRPLALATGLGPHFPQRGWMGNRMKHRDQSEDFRRVVLDPEAWRKRAGALIEAAELIAPKIDEFWQGVRTRRSWDDAGVAVYFMLCSFALENLVKAKIVEKKRSELEARLASGSSLPELLKGHDLYRLMREAGLSALAAEEEALLRRLTRSAVWYGRYPAPVTAAGLSRFRESMHKDFEISLTEYSSADRDDIRRLLGEAGWRPTP